MQKLQLGFVAGFRLKKVKKNTELLQKNNKPAKIYTSESWSRRFW